MVEKTREPQYQCCLEIRDHEGATRLGLMTNQTWKVDPKRLVFMLSRYKFVAKMLSGKKKALEVGCADAFGTRIVRQEVPDVTAIDFDPIFVQDALQHMDPQWPFKCLVHDLLDGPVNDNFDAAYSLDVLEHIPPEHEHRFVQNIVGSLAHNGVLIIGTPSIQSQPYASKLSLEGHVNCKSQPDLKKLLVNYFQNVFMFSMNDEVVHTGFHPMANYLFAVCAGCGS